MHLDGFGGAPWYGGAHGKMCAIVHVHGHVNKVLCKVEAVKGAFDAGPREVVVCFGYVIENGIACFGCRACWSGVSFPEACCDGVDRFVDVFPLEECELAGV